MSDLLLNASSKTVQFYDISQQNEISGYGDSLIMAWDIEYTDEVEAWRKTLSVGYFPMPSIECHRNP